MSRRSVLLKKDFLKYASGRDGELSGKTLSKREQFFDELEPPKWEGQTVDVDRLTGLIDKSISIKDASRLERFLLAVALVDVGESWGVNYGLKRNKVVQDPVKNQVYVQELYHGRLLDEMLVPFGIDRPRTSPSPLLRGFIMSMFHTPRKVADFASAAGEIMGAVTFVQLIEQARKLLAEDPKTQDYVLKLLHEILTDELGHVALLVRPMGFIQRKLLHLALHLTVGMIRFIYCRDGGGNTFRDGVLSFSLDSVPTELAGQAFLWEPLG